LGGYRILVGVGIATIGVISIIVALNLSQGTISLQDYEILVDPLKDEQSLFTMARVTIHNLGSKSLTNIEVNYGNGDTELIPKLFPGQKVIVSPPSNNPMSFVTVTSDEGIFVKKPYRIPTKIPGMMGS